MLPRTSDQPKPLSGLSLPSDVEPAEREFVLLLERALAPSFTLVRRLGAGGMGSVYLARDPVLKRLVAVKVMAPSLAADPVARARFEREAQAVASISHPNVVAVYSVGELANGIPYLVMQYVEGRAMSERLETDGPLDVLTAKRVLGEVASALVAAHRKGIIHRDIKPANILWDDETGRALVTDFGIAAVLERGDERDATRITHTGMAIGTPAYMSPEQLLAEPITAKTDIYSLGLLGYELLVGEGPYQISSPREVMAAHLRDEPRHLSSMRADVDAELERLLENCLAKDPAQRPSAADVEGRLMHGASVLLEWPPPGLESLRESFRQALRLLLIGALVAGIPVVALTVFDRESAVRQMLPQNLLVVFIAILGTMVFTIGSTGVLRFFKAGGKAVADGYGWGTVAEAAADVRGDTGALIAGAREYAALSAEQRSALRRYRVAAATLQLVAGLVPILGYLIAILATARWASGPTITLWSTIILSFSLLAAARVIRWQEDRSLRASRKRLRSAAARKSSMDRLAATWMSAFEQVRVGQSLGAGPTKHRLLVRIATETLVVLAGLTAVLIVIVLAYTTVMSQIIDVAVPKFSNTHAKFAKVERLAAYRLSPDLSISGLRAGQALHAITRAGFTGPPLKWEKAPAIVIPNAAPSVGKDPFAYVEGGWAAAAFRDAPRGFTEEQRDFLESLADNAALDEFQLLARAPSLDLIAAYWDIPPGKEPWWPELPIPKFIPLRIAAQSNTARAALDLAAGKPREAERRLREVISAGFLMIEDGDNLLVNLIGASLVTNARTSLVAFFDATGRAREARSVSAENDPAFTIVEQRGRQTSRDENLREVRRVILDRKEIRGIRWELLLSSFALEPCADMHQVIFGTDSLHRATLAEARRTLVRRPSDSLLFSIAERGIDSPATADVARSRAVRATRPFGRVVTALTGHRQFEGCLALLGLMGH
jgi:tRNA A-37 threonylcarbamoyl transferase component Bud32